MTAIDIAAVPQQIRPVTKSATGRPAVPPRRRRRQARGILTRRRLLEAARELFSRHGFAGVSLADVARRTGCGMSVAYYHFPDKRDLFLELVDEWGKSAPVEQRTAFDIRTALDGAPRKAAIEYLRRSYQELRKGPSLSRVIVAEAERDPEVRRRYEAAQQIATTWLAMMTRLGQQVGIVRTDRNPDATAYLLHHVIDSTLADLVTREIPERLRESVIEEMAEMIGAYLIGDRPDTGRVRAKS